MFVVTLCVLVCLYALWARKSARVGVCPPLYSGCLPIIGHAHKMLGNSEAFYHRVCSMAKECNEKGGVMLVKICLADYYILTDPEDFTTAANSCLKVHYTYDFMKPWFGAGLVTGSDVPVWRRHRKLLSPAFGQHVIDGFSDIFNSLSKKMVEDMEAKAGRGPFNHADYLERFMLTSVCQTSFGVNADELENFDISTYLDAVNKMLQIIGKRIQQWWLHSDALYSVTKQKREQDSVSDYLNDVCRSVLKLKKKKILDNHKDYNGMKFKAFMDLALELSRTGELTETEVYEEMNTIISAGYETTANVLMYTFLLLGSHANVQNKVYDELQSVFGDSDRDVEKEDLSKLVYLDAVIKESMRVYTITPALMREVETDVKLKNYTMPAGSHCILLTFGLHCHPSWGTDVEQFKPERWLDQTRIDPKAFAGFGVGKRLCLGQSFAMISMKITLAHMLRRYSVSSDRSKAVLKMEPLLKPVNGHQIALELRRSI